MANFPESAKGVRQEFGYYSGLGEETAVEDGADGITPLRAAEAFAALQLSSWTKHDREKTLKQVTVWKNLQAGEWWTYPGGEFDCDVQMDSAKNLVGEPKVTTSSYKIILRITGKKNLEPPGVFTAELYDWSIAQTPASVTQGTYVLEGGLYTLQPFVAELRPVVSAVIRPFARRMPRAAVHRCD